MGIGAIKIYRHNPTGFMWILAAIAVLLVMWTQPNVLAPFLRVWKYVGHIIGAINNRIILFLLYFFVMLPYGIILKFFRVRLLDTQIHKDWGTYFEPRLDVPTKMKNLF